MVQSKVHNGDKRPKRAKTNNHNNNSDQYSKLASMGKISVDLINKMYNPVDAAYRFVNLALQRIEEDSQSRQFLLESKSGLRKMSTLLKKLNNYAKKIEKEMVKLKIVEGDD